MPNRTRILVRTETKAQLDTMRVSRRDTYNDIIETLIEDSMELSDEAKKDIEEAFEDYEQGRVCSIDDVKMTFEEKG